MTDHTPVDALDVSEHSIEHIEHPDTGLAVQVDGDTYIPDPETEIGESGR